MLKQKKDALSILTSKWKEILSPDVEKSQKRHDPKLTKNSPRPPTDIDEGVVNVSSSPEIFPGDDAQDMGPHDDWLFDWLFEDSEAGTKVAFHAPTTSPQNRDARCGTSANVSACNTESGCFNSESQEENKENIQHATERRTTDSAACRSATSRRTPLLLITFSLLGMILLALRLQNHAETLVPMFKAIQSKSFVRDDAVEKRGSVPWHQFWSLQLNEQRYDVTSLRQIGKESVTAARVFVRSSISRITSSASITVADIHWGNAPSFQAWFTSERVAFGEFPHLNGGSPTNIPKNTSRSGPLKDQELVIKPDETDHRFSKERGYGNESRGRGNIREGEEDVYPNKNKSTVTGRNDHRDKKEETLSLQLEEQRHLAALAQLQKETEIMLASARAEAASATASAESTVPALSLVPPPSDQRPGLILIDEENPQVSFSAPSNHSYSNDLVDPPTSNAMQEDTFGQQHSHGIVTSTQIFEETQVAEEDAKGGRSWGFQRIARLSSAVSKKIRRYVAITALILLIVV